MAAGAGGPGCPLPGPAGLAQPGMTPQEAAAYADSILHRTAAALRPRPRLEFSEEFSDTAARCPGGPDADQMVVVTRCYWLRGITGPQYAAAGEQVLAHWRRLRWTITDTAGVRTRRPVIGALAPPYAFRVSLEWSAAGRGGLLSLTAASVCLWPDGISCAAE
jgi:hypothetical protein